MPRRHFPERSKMTFHGIDTIFPTVYVYICQGWKITFYIFNAFIITRWHVILVSLLPNSEVLYWIVVRDKQIAETEIRSLGDLFVPHSDSFPMNPPKRHQFLIFTMLLTKTLCKIHREKLNIRILRLRQLRILAWPFRIGECPSIAPFLEKNGPRPRKGPMSIVFKEWNDTRTFAYIKSTQRLQPLPQYM